MALEQGSDAARNELLQRVEIWDRWLDPSDGPIDTFTIITTRPNSFMRPLHDRMPVVLDPSDVETWLDPASSSPDARHALLQPCGDETLIAHRVSTYVPIRR